MTLLSSYVKIIANEFKDAYLFLDGGDEMQGSLDSNYFDGKSAIDVLNYAKLNAAVIGNHEFAFGIDKLKERLAQAQYNFYVANFIETATSKIPE